MMRRFVCCASMPVDDDSPPSTPVENVDAATAPDDPILLSPDQILIGAFVLVVWWTYTARLMRVFVPPTP